MTREKILAEFVTLHGMQTRFAIKIKEEASTESLDYHAIQRIHGYTASYIEIEAQLTVLRNLLAKT
jgi:hypothetical protein